MILDRLIFWGLCAVLILLPLPFGATEEWAVFGFEVAAVVLYALHLIREWKGGGSSPRVNETVGPEKGGALPAYLKILLFVFLALSVVQLVPLPMGFIRVVSPGTSGAWDALSREGMGLAREGGWRTLSLIPALSSYELAKVAACALFAWLVFKRVRRKIDVEIFVLVLVIGAALQSLYGLAEHFGGTEQIFGYKKVNYVGSATGTFINRNHFSGFLEMLFPLALGYLLARTKFFGLRKGLSLKEKVLWLGQEKLQKAVVIGLVPVLIGLGIIFSRSRTGIFVFLATLALAAVLISAAGWSGGGGRRVAGTVRTVALVVLFAAVLIGIRPVIERFSWSDLEKEQRPVFYRNTLGIVSDYPLTGTGAGTFQNAYPRYQKKSTPWLLDHAHNDYLEILAESGLPGGGCLILAAFGILVVLYGRWAGRRDPFVKGILLGALLGITALLIHSLTDFNLRIPANAAYFVALYALALRLSVMGRHNRSASGVYIAAEPEESGRPVNRAGIRSAGPEEQGRA